MIVYIDVLTVVTEMFRHFNPPMHQLLDDGGVLFHNHTSNSFGSLATALPFRNIPMLFLFLL